MGKFSQGLVLCLCVYALTACDALKKEDQIAETSDKIKSQSEHLSKRTDDLERELVNKESNTTFADFLDLLFGEGKFGKEPISEPTLLLDAGFAVESMHFQYWKGDYNEPVAVLDDFYTQALEIMFVHMTSHIPRDYDVDVLIPNRDYKAVGSLAAKIDRVRPEYAANLKLAGISNMSAYDIILKALQDRNSYARTETLPKATATVLQWKQDAIYLLQLRQIYLPLTVLARMTNFQDQNSVFAWKFWDTRLWDGWFGGLRVNLGLDSTGGKAIDPEELKSWTQWLNQSLQTRQALKDMCIEPLSNSFVNKILAKVNLDNTGMFASDADKQVRNDFIEAYKKVVAQTTTASSNVTCANR